jgi:predicted dehydrogenase
MLKGGVIGFGGVGQSLTKNINKQNYRARIVAVCDRNKAKLDIAEKDFGLKTTHNAEELCSWDLDFVMVLSSNSAHKEHVLAAVNNNRAIFCEKPIAIKLADAEEMINAVEKANLVNTVNYSLRYKAMTDQLKIFMQGDDIGDVLSVSYEKSRAYGLNVSGKKHWATDNLEESGGWIVHHCCHQIDLLYYLFGPFQDIYCTTNSTITDKDSEELIFATGHLKNGAMFHIGDSLSQIAYGHLIVSGSKGSFTSQQVDQFSFERIRNEKWDRDVPLSFDSSWIRGKGKHPRSVEHFFDCIEGKAESISTLKSSLESLRVAYAMKESAKTGQVINMDSFRL